MSRVLVTPTSFDRYNPAYGLRLESSVDEVVYNPFDRPLRAAELSRLIRGFDGFIAGLDEIDARVIRAADRLRVIARYGVGVDRVDVSAATARGIVVSNTPGANSTAVAELAVGLILGLARALCCADLATRRGEWPRLDGVGIQGKTIGLLGFGAIGRRVAVRLQGFDCTLIACDPFADRAQAARLGVDLVALEDMLHRSDFVSLHLPAVPETEQMVNRALISMMKPGSFLVNTARGELVDESALLEALEGGHLRGAALDCFSTEPLSPQHPLAKSPHLILTPHTGAHTDEAVNQMGIMAVEACLAVLSGERPAHVVNSEIYSHYPDRKDSHDYG